MIIQGMANQPPTKLSLSPGAQAPLRQGNMGDAVVSELHGRYYEAAYRSTMFTGANTAGQVTTVGTATTYTGLCLSNPLASNTNIVLNKVGLAFLVVWPAAAAVGLMCGYNGSVNVTHTTPVTPRSTYIGGAVGVGLLDSAATLSVTPTITHIFGAGLTGAITVQTIETSFFDLEGSVILPPGAFAAIYTSTVTAAAGMFASMQWEEVPV